MVKPGISIERHIEIGVYLSEMHAEIQTLACEIENAFPRSSKIDTKFRSLTESLLRLRSNLEDLGFSAHGDLFKTSVYFGSQQQNIKDKKIDLQDIKDIALIRGVAAGYALALYSHFDEFADGFDKEAHAYLTQQADWVRGYPEKVLQFLRSQGVHGENGVTWKYLQYFFAIQPPVYEPYQNLWNFVFNELNKSGFVNKKSLEAFNRLASGGSHSKRLLYQSPEGV
jgi:phosphoenolpyruvate-protein kinase (PTS system EI component)